MRTGRLATSRGATALVWTTVGVWAVWALIRLTGIEFGFPLVPLLAFTPWMALAAPAPVVVALALGRRAAAALAVAVAVVFAAIVLPRAFGGETEPEGATGPALRVMAANMKLGQGDPVALVSLVDELDVEVLSVEELTGHLAEALDSAGLRRLLPYRAVESGPSSSGSGLYSAIPLGPGTSATLPGGFPLISHTPRLTGAAGFEISSVHTVPPTDYGVGRWKEDLEALPATQGAPPRILLGDFNATLDHEAFRDLLDRGYADAAETLGDGLTMTWPANRLLPPLVAIDHVLADERIGFREFSAHDIPGSDHRAVFADLLLPAGY